MASKIRIIPTLKGSEALRFVKTSDVNAKIKGTIDFTNQLSIASRILQKSNINPIKYETNTLPRIKHDL